VLSLSGDALESAVALRHQPLPQMPAELRVLFDEAAARAEASGAGDNGTGTPGSSARTGAR
jgi:hypothetical protein